MGLYRSWIGDALAAVGLPEAGDYVDELADGLSFTGATWAHSSGDELFTYSQDREAGQDVKNALDVAGTYVPGADRITEPLKSIVDVYQGDYQSAAYAIGSTAAGKAAEKVLDSATSVVKSSAVGKKRVPNQYGRKGGLEHQGKVDEIEQEIVGRGNQPKR